ncbi:MAG: 3-hydroxyacyl-ACP dehydratase FabZ [Gammaproteobacteria bacterium]|nr:3-hydroxyacyl-ACP dehydratase FabZ [Gammaproteobacteria bacterium]
MNIQEILKHLPLRYPFLLIDKVLEFTPGKSLIAIKNVTVNEPFFQGHFPTRPVMPGVLIIEALAQATAILAIKTSGKTIDVHKLVYYLVGIDKARFKKIVSAGDQLRLEVHFAQGKQMLSKFHTKAWVDGQLVCSAEILTAYKEIESLDK